MTVNPASSLAWHFVPNLLGFCSPEAEKQGHIFEILDPPTWNHVLWQTADDSDFNIDYIHLWLVYDVAQPLASSIRYRM